MLMFKWTNRPQCPNLLFLLKHSISFSEKYSLLLSSSCRSFSHCLNVLRSFWSIQLRTVYSKGSSLLFPKSSFSCKWILRTISEYLQWTTTYLDCILIKRVTWKVGLLILLQIMQWEPVMYLVLPVPPTESWPLYCILYCENFLRKK